MNDWWQKGLSTFTSSSVHACWKYALFMEGITFKQGTFTWIGPQFCGQRWITSTCGRTTLCLWWATWTTSVWLRSETLSCPTVLHHEGGKPSPKVPPWAPAVVVVAFIFVTLGWCLCPCSPWSWSLSWVLSVIVFVVVIAFSVALLDRGGPYRGFPQSLAWTTALPSHIALYAAPQSPTDVLACQNGQSTAPRCGFCDCSSWTWPS